MKKHLRPIKMCNYPTLSSKISLETEFASNDTFGDRFGYSKGINHIHSRVIKICRKMLNFTQQEVIKLLRTRCLRAAFANILFAQFANFVSNTQILDSTSHYIISVMT